ncbi:hypothetical protein FQR65_LT11486 [Abscondita terminalis]|nr:hypothetical protein FQR65_LT11486 [Abscondita terminalis]
MTWTRQHISQLIDLCREHEVLYAVKNELYHNKSARNTALEDIVVKLQIVRPGTTGDRGKLEEAGDEDQWQIFGNYVASELRNMKKREQKQCKNSIARVLLQFQDSDEEEELN